MKIVDNAWLIIDELDKKVDDAINKKDLMMIKAEIYKNYIKDDMIRFRLHLQIKRVLGRIDDRLDIIEKLK